ncbi:hypothetical protein Tsubulata_007978, partial [Turnera subulata]
KKKKKEKRDDDFKRVLTGRNSLSNTKFKDDEGRREVDAGASESSEQIFTRIQLGWDHSLCFDPLFRPSATLSLLISLLATTALMSLPSVAVSRGLNGIGLAIVVPAIQSLVADSTNETNRGTAFGWLQLTGNLGSILGNLCAILIASTSVMGIPGWRVAFHLVAIISVIVGILIRLFAKDPHFSDNINNGSSTSTAKDDKNAQTFISAVKDLLKESKSVMKIPSFQVLVAQGVAGTFPWSGLSFAPMWFELIGFSHEQTALIMTLNTIGASFGSLFGGKAGDFLARSMPNTGRILLSQISAGSSIPFAAVLLLILPDHPSSAFMHGLVYFIMGVFTSWNAPATNNPIFAEIVPEKSRTTIYALDMSFENVLSSFAPPIVGLLAQNVYGFKTPEKSQDSGKIETDRQNAGSLAKALFTAFLIPMTICVFIYSFLYWTYPRDRERARMVHMERMGALIWMKMTRKRSFLHIKHYQEEERLTLVLVNLAAIMERADESLLPGVYKEVGAALHTDPTGLGSLTLFRSIVQTSCYPLAAYLATRHNRAHVAVSRGLNGIGLAIVIPAIQSLVADSTDETNRGTAFGWLQLTASLGSILGNLCSILIASTSVMGIPGWRVAFHLVAVISVIVGILVRLFAKDPHFADVNNGSSTSTAKDDKKAQTFISEVKDLLKESKYVLVAQGVAGTFPGSGLSFAAMWFELNGFSHEQTALIMTLNTIGASFGSLFGGKAGDILARSMPNTGRILLSQISAGSSIPFAAVLLLILPDHQSSAFMHGLVYFVMGVFTSWNAPATNNPIFAEIVPDKSRTTIYALDRSFEHVLSSFAPPIVGLLAQNVYGFKTPEKSQDSGKIETDRENAASLAKALFTAFLIPMSICVFIYSFLYWTYPRDRERARMIQLVESEMQRIEEDDSASNQDDNSQMNSCGSKEQHGEEFDMEYGKDGSIDFVENDKKPLLSTHQTLSS